jgi:glycosyltransferase involved in cell wall biosynthesis
MKPDIICFSHLRWNFVYQRPQHILSRLAKSARVFYFEEPLFDSDCGSYYHIYKDLAADVRVVVPHLPMGLNEEQIIDHQRSVLNSLLHFQGLSNYMLWYYSPMAYAFSDHLDLAYVVYDCMDELSAFLFAPPALRQNEMNLLQRADIVFTGGSSLYQAKKHLHLNIHLFPSSIDKSHFFSARKLSKDPMDQIKIPGPRIGFYGVIDERLDIALLTRVAGMRPDWQFILIGPVVKIDPANLPQRSNIHYLGPKKYAELPEYLAGWDIAMIPFALNESTKFISPTKTPEYLAGGKPVISPSIADVVDPYGDMGLVKIADTPEQFIDAGDEILISGVDAKWQTKVEAFLNDMSWDKTVGQMTSLIEQGIKGKTNASPEKVKSHV